MVGVYQRITVTGIYSPSFYYFYFSAGEFTTGQLPMPHIISLLKQVCLGEFKTNPLASEKGRKLH